MTYGQCRHCGRRKATRSRRLCDVCYRDTSIRDCYPILDVPANLRGVPDRCGVQPAPERPSEALPGTALVGGEPIAERQVCAKGTQPDRKAKKRRVG